MKARIGLIVGLSMLLALFFSGTATAEKGSLVAGSYWMEVAPEGFFSLPGILTLNADGVVLASQYLSPFTNNGRGNWRKLNSRGAKGRFLSFNYAPDGTPTTIIEVTFEGEFDQPYENGEMAFVISWYSPEQNPLDEEPAYGQNTGFFYLRRIPTDQRERRHRLSTYGSRVSRRREELTADFCWPEEQNLLADPVQDLLQNAVLLLKRVDSVVIFNIGKNIDWTRGTQYTQIDDGAGA